MALHPLQVERERRGWSQARVAEALGVSTRTVTRWEQRVTIPYPYYREQLAHLFGKSVQDLGLLPTGQEAGPSVVGAWTDHVQATAPVAARSAVTSAAGPALLDPFIPLLLGRQGHLVGRAALFQQIKAQLFAGQRLALTALGGLPGVGKTALAVALCLDAQVQEEFADGILWAGMGLHPDRLSLLAHWGTLVGLRAEEVEDASNWQAWGRTLRAVIGQRRMLLVIDDAWSAEEALALQVGGQNCVHLLTTRLPQVAFAFAQKQVLSVPELLEEESLELLARYMPQLVEQEREQARELVRAVSGLPLAVSLMGKYLAGQSFTGQPRRVRQALEQLRQVQHRLLLAMPTAPLERPPHLEDDTPLSLQAAIAVSDAHLSSAAHAALCTLAIFPAKPHSFSEEAALAVSQQEVEVLDELWDVGLLEHSGVGRYFLHQTIVDYARGQGPQIEAQARLVRYMLSLIQEQNHMQELLELEINTIQAALEAARELGMSRELIVGVRVLAPFAQRRGSYLLGDQYLLSAIKAAMEVGDTPSQISLRQYRAHLARTRGETQQAEEDGMRGLELARAQGDLEAQSELLAILSQVASDRGEYEQAINVGEQGLQLAKQARSSKCICGLLRQLAWIAVRQGRHDQAWKLVQEGLELARQLADDELLVRLLNIAGQIAAPRGDIAQAETYFAEALALARQLGHRSIQASLMNNLAVLAAAYGDDKQAESYYLEALVLARRIGERHNICIYLSNLGTIANRHHDYVKAERYLLEGLELARQSDLRASLPTLLTNLGEAACYQGDDARAMAYFEEALTLARQAKAITSLSNTLVNLGDTHLHFQRLEEAAAAYQEVLSLDGVDRQIETWARYGLARVAALLEKMTLAWQLGRECLMIFEALGHGKAAEVAQWLQNLKPPIEEGSSSPSGSLSDWR